MGKVSAGEAFVRVSMDNSALGKGLTAAQRKLESFSAAATGWASDDHARQVVSLPLAARSWPR